MKWLLLCLVFVFSFVPIFSKINGSITAISVKQNPTGIEITFTSDKELSRFQKPEVAGNTIIFRINDIQHKIGKIPKPKNVSFLKETKVIILKNLVAYSFQTSKNILTTQVSKKSDKVLVLTITLSKPPKTKTSKPIAKGKTQQKTTVTKKETIEKIEIDKTLLEVEIEPKKTSTLPLRFQDLNVVVIDAGHGGEDVGAISINGHYEKDVTLAISLELQKLFKKHFPKMKVIMTRTTDEFIELGTRASIANKAKGDLFISIHCNATAEKPSDANGCETYILRPAVVESSSDKKGVDSKTKDDGLKRASKEQSNYLPFSELFATIIQKEVPNTIGLTNRGVQTAGFFVLAGAKMPNILFEAGFLTNETDEKILTSTKQQRKIANALFKAFLLYRKEFQNLF